jgi:hypothetical protein
MSKSLGRTLVALACAALLHGMCYPFDPQVGVLTEQLLSARTNVSIDRPL